MVGAMVDDQSHGHREIFVYKKADRLRDAILINPEILLGQTGDKAASPVGHRRVQGHQRNVHRDSERCRVVCLLLRHVLISRVARQNKQQEGGKSDCSDCLCHAMFSRPRQPRPP